MSELIGGTSVQLQSSPLAQDVTKQTQVQFSEHWLSFKKLYKPHLAALRKKHFLCTVIQPPHLRVVWGHQNNCPGCDNCTFVKVTINRSETCEMHTCTNCSRKQLCKIIAQVVFYDNCYGYRSKTCEWDVCENKYTIVTIIVIYCGSAQMCISKLTRWCLRPCHISKADCLFLH